MELEVAIDDLTLPDAPNSKLIGEDQDKLDDKLFQRALWMVKTSNNPF